jgi:xanthine dehydrogenase molybdopterin-binding subunit B
MRELGLPAERIRMMKTSTDKVPNTSATAASAGADLNGAAVRAACATLRERMAPVAARLLESDVGAALRRDLKQDGPEGRGVKPLPQLAYEDGHVFDRARPERRVPFVQVVRVAMWSASAFRRQGTTRRPEFTGTGARSEGRPFAYLCLRRGGGEVEVDGYTGMTRVRRVDIVHDVGDSLNPGVDRGQIEGGFVQGMGWLTSEELKWDAKGRLLTHSASTYQIPAISDAPMEFNVTLLPRRAAQHAVHGSKAVGEPPLMLALSVREAIRDAVAAFGAPGGEVRLASPATGEAVFAAIQCRSNGWPLDIDHVIPAAGGWPGRHRANGPLESRQRGGLAKQAAQDENHKAERDQQQGPDQARGHDQAGDDDLNDAHEAKTRQAPESCKAESVGNPGAVSNRPPAGPARRGAGRRC